MAFNELDLSILKTIVTNKKYAIDFANECDPKLFSSDIWNAAKLCSKNKQEVSIELAQELVKAVDEIAVIFQKTKLATPKK